MDITYGGFFYEGYWWISLLGGLHCVGLGAYINYFYREHNNTHKLLSAIFILISIYFLTALINQHNAPFSIQTLLFCLAPTYFLLTPLLYLYCYRSLHNLSGKKSHSWHYLPAALLALVILCTFLLSSDFRAYIQSNGQEDAGYYILFSALIPLLLAVQATIYFLLIFNLLKQFKGLINPAHHNGLKAIKFRWLMLLTSAMLINGILRTIMLILPIYLGDSISMTAQAITNFGLLVTVYGLAIYGIKHITITAYLRGSQSRQKIQSKVKSSKELLSADEITYLKDLMQPKKKE
ncbi:hypothetical protein LZP69_13890 [Shewanella sp. AS1]|uniref:hypothetical protein n=1 Tax=Shewanella sp. AS1 TaxID=2907626 RepID=UPI001F23375F|nr:hypothetical protein [Shewanella sp. AS1]MCE9680250.1 hypothetical protein [Shewanella sp. AS1]